MRVLHLTTEFPPLIYGGLGTAVGGLVNASATAGLTVGVLPFGQSTSGGYGRFTDSAEASSDKRTVSGVGEVTILEACWSQDFQEIVRMVASWKPDILHLHSFWLWRVAQGLRDHLAKPLVYTVHSLDKAEYEIGEGPSECIAQWGWQEGVIRSADRIIALSQCERELLNQYCPGVDDRVRVIGNGIDDLVPSTCGRLHSSVETIVLFSGRFVERKGIHELIEAIGIVLAELPSVRFVLAGGHRNSTAAEMESWLLPASLHEKRDKIQFTGWLTPEQMAEWYEKADILVVPSWYEPFGMVVLEGMLHGLAIAAAAVGGPAEILDHGRTGILFAPRNAQVLAQAILLLSISSKTRRRVGEAGLREVREMWLWPKIVEKIRSVYEEVT